MRLIVPVAGIVSLFTVLASSCAPPAPGPIPPNASVVEIVDGDTIVVRSGDQEIDVRLLGIDTPEVAHHGNPDECGGPEAAARLAAMVPPGTLVQLARDQEARDIYGRLLAYVIRSSDGTVVNVSLAAEGHARPLAIAPNLMLADQVAAAADDAQRNGLGIWAACDP